MMKMNRLLNKDDTRFGGDPKVEVEVHHQMIDSYKTPSFNCSKCPLIRSAFDSTWA